MRVLLQRVLSASVTVEGRVTGQISGGLLAFVGFGPGDTPQLLDRMASRVLDLRIFEDEAGKMNRSLRDLATESPDLYGLLLVSQFTLYADTRKGRRPSFAQAAPSEMAHSLFSQFAQNIRDQGFSVAEGLFGEHMVVALQNDGPVTIWLDSDEFPTP